MIVVDVEHRYSKPGQPAHCEESAVLGLERLTEEAFKRDPYMIDVCAGKDDGPRSRDNSKIYGPARL